MSFGILVFSERVLKNGVDVVFGTPGRIQDMVNKGTLVLDSLKYVILDEVDRMLDMGFADYVDAIIKHAYTGEILLAIKLSTVKLNILSYLQAYENGIAQELP